MAKSKANEAIVVTAPNFKWIDFEIEGTTPLVINRFGSRRPGETEPTALDKMVADQTAGGASKSKRKRDPKNWDALYEQAKHISTEGWCGIHAAAFRNALVSACRTVGVVMTRAKLAVHCEEDGIDHDGTPLVRITKGEPEKFQTSVRNDSGVTDVRVRPMWKPGWRAVVRLRFDADMMSAETVANLLARAGAQVGIGEGRPDSKKSCGQGWGLFRLVTQEEDK